MAARATPRPWSGSPAARPDRRPAGDLAAAPRIALTEHAHLVGGADPETEGDGYRRKGYRFGRSVADNGYGLSLDRDVSAARDLTALGRTLRPGAPPGRVLRSPAPAA